MTWKAEIDFRTDGSFATDITGRVLSMTSWTIGVQYPKHVSGESGPTLTLDNDDRHFSPDWVGGPYYDLMRPNVPIRIAYDNEIIFFGLVDDFEPTLGQYGDNLVKIPCSSLVRIIDQDEYYHPLQENVTLDQVIQLIILNHPVPARSENFWTVADDYLGVGTYLGTIDDQYDADTGYWTFPYVGDNSTGLLENLDRFYDENQVIERNRTAISAWQMIKDLNNIEQGYVFFGQDGKLVFRPRFYLDDQAQLNAIVDNDYHGRPDYKTPLSEYKNVVEVQYSPRDISGSNTVTIWDSEESFTIPAKGTRTITAIHDSKLGARRIRRPAAAESTLTHTGDEPFVAIEPSAQRTKIIMSNQGTSDIDVTYVALLGQTMQSAGDNVVRLTDAVDKHPYEQLFKFSAKSLTEYADALDLAKRILDERSIFTGRVHSYEQFGRPTSGGDDLIALGFGSLIRFIDDQAEHDRYYHIVGKRYSIDVPRDYWKVLYYLKPATRIVVATHRSCDGDLTLNTGSSDEALGQSFVPTANWSVNAVNLKLKRTGFPDGTLTCKLWSATTGDLPLSLLDTSDTVTANNIDHNYEWIRFDFPAEVSLMTTGTYVLTLEHSEAADASEYISLAADSTQGYTDGTASIKASGTWATTAKDACFEVLIHASVDEIYYLMADDGTTYLTADDGTYLRT